MLESDDEEGEVGQGGDEGLQVEDLLSPEREDRAAEEAVWAPPPTIIILSDCVEADKPRAPKGA